MRNWPKVIGLLLLLLYVVCVVASVLFLAWAVIGDIVNCAGNNVC